MAESSPARKGEYPLPPLGEGIKKGGHSPLPITALC